MFQDGSLSRSQRGLFFPVYCGNLVELLVGNHTALMPESPGVSLRVICPEIAAIHPLKGRSPAWHCSVERCACGRSGQTALHRLLVYSLRPGCPSPRPYLHGLWLSQRAQVLPVVRTAWWLPSSFHLEPVNSLFILSTMSSAAQISNFRELSLILFLSKTMYLVSKNSATLR